MTPERYQRIGQLFDEALERPTEERSAYLDRACGDDADLRSDVEKLLARHSASGDFLSRPAIEVAAELLAKDRIPFAPGKKISHYQILSLLGAGGMGEVYLAEDVRLKRKVALKVLPEAIARDPDRLRRFEKEAFAASALNHPNILTIYEFGAEGDTHFLATEFIDGETVRSRLVSEPFPVKEAIDISAQAAQALSTAHQAGIIHRDIKPENVMIRNDGIVKVLDFGLAKLVESSPVEAEGETRMQGLTQVGTIVGTVAYMSPEQARGKTLDPRTDIFSLGVVLYEMLTRRHPFIGETMSHTMVAILEKEPAPLAQSVREVPVELERIVDKALAKKADDRYQNAAALLADLKQLERRLEFNAEPARAPQGGDAYGSSNSALHTGEAPTQIVKALDTKAELDPARTSVRAITLGSTRSARLGLLGGILVLIILGVGAWQWLGSKSAISPAATPVNAASALPERNLSYSLTVQKYRDGRPYQQEFQSSGREIFEGGWKFKLNLVSRQEGFLYLLNQEPGEPGDSYRLLFPVPWRDNGSAHLGANERRETDWYFFDDQTGKERFRVVWAAGPVPQLEAVRGLVNKTTKGLISDPTQIQAVREFLQENEASQIAIDKETNKTNVTGRGPVLVTLIELEHQ
jgi:serine/threonine protein kinase